VRRFFPFSFSIAATLAALVSVAVPHDARADQPVLLPLGPVDVDDDDRDGVRDADDPLLTAEGLADLVPLPPALLAKPKAVMLSGDGVRLRIGGRLDGAPGARGPLALQGRKPGRFPVTAARSSLLARFAEVRLLDGESNPIDPVRGGLEMMRKPPEPLPADPFAALATRGESAFRAVIIADPDDVPSEVTVQSFGPDGRPIDALNELGLTSVPCPADVREGLACGSTLPLRLVMDEIDRQHPLVEARSLQAELGGGIVVATGPERRRLLLARVLGPRSTPAGAIDRLLGTLRIFLVRARPGGGPPFGENDAMALALVARQIRRTNQIWGQCGVTFGSLLSQDVRLVDPPVPHLLAVGCGLGSPASGGTIRFRVDERELTLRTREGESPQAIGRRLAAAVEKLGFVAVISDNTRIAPGALPTTDVLVRHRNGTPALVRGPEEGALSADRTLGVCIGAVDLSDGLQHFTDGDAVAGSLEERSLLKFLDDGDPTTIEVVFVPSFATGGRIGESFIRGDRSSLSNMVIEDRAGIRSDRIAFALAHELGHVLLDVPGHSDDFGIDSPTRLMDSDSADPSAFGPRRLSADECARAVRESGPAARVPILKTWPLERLPMPPPLAISTPPGPSPH
jgi:hypothetical protein